MVLGTAVKLVLFVSVSLYVQHILYENAQSENSSNS